jgi:hypothetical protein
MQSMKNQKSIVLFDTDPYYRINVELLLDRVGLNLTRAVSNVEESKKLVKDMESGAIKPDVVFMDDYLAQNFNDASRIAEKLKSINKEVKIVHYTIVRDEEQPKWADAVVIKSGLDNNHSFYETLGELIGEKLDVEKAHEVEGD